MEGAERTAEGTAPPTAEAGPSGTGGVQQTRSDTKRFTNIAAYGGFRGVQQQQIDSLMAALPEALRELDYSRIASLVSILIKALNPVASMKKEGPEVKRRLQSKAGENMKATLLAGLEYLYHNPNTCSHEHLRRFLRNMQMMEADPQEAQVLALEVGYLLLQAGQDGQAHSMFINPPPQPTAQGMRFALASAAGHLRYQQWAQAWAEAGVVADVDGKEGLEGLDAMEEDGLETDRLRGASIKLEHAAASGSGSLLGEFAFDELRWARSGREAQELWREAEASLREAFNVQPAAVEVAYLLAHLYCAAGRFQQALDVAAKLRSEAGNDADAVALQILLLEASHEQDASITDSLSKAYLDLLRCDSGSSDALDGLLYLHRRSTLVPDVLLECLLLHLDGLTEGPSVSTAWCALASLLEHSANQAAEVSSLKDKHAAASIEGGCQDLPDRGVVHEPRSTEQAGSGHSGELGAAAWVQWCRIQNLLSSRKLWWPAMHFSVQPRATWLSKDPALADKAVCAALMIGCHAGFCKAAMRALLDGGNHNAVKRVDDMLGSFEMLQEAGSRANATGSHGAALGEESLDFGTIMQLPQSWWRAIPHYRRKHSSRSADTMS